MDQGNDRLLLLLSAFAVCLNGNHSGKVDALVYCANQEDIPLLRQVNKDIENYLLLYSNSLTRAMTGEASFDIRTAQVQEDLLRSRMARESRKTIF
jgi:hypothetical protein